MRSCSIVLQLVVFSVLLHEAAHAQQYGSFPREPESPPVSAAWDATLGRAAQARQQNRPADALADLERAAKVEEMHGADEAWFQFEVAQSQEALNHIEEAIQAAEKSATVFHNLQTSSGLDTSPEEMLIQAYVGCLLMNNQSPGGEDRLRQALKMARAEKTRPAAMLGSLHTALNNLRADIPVWNRQYLEAARDISGTYAPGSWEHAEDLDQLAWLYLDIAELDRAVETFQEAETIYANLQRKLLDIEKEEEQAVKSSPQDVLRAQEAQKQKEQRLGRIRGFAEDKGRDLVGRSLSLHQKGDTAAARALLDAAVKFLEQESPGSDVHMQALVARGRVETDTESFVEASADLFRVVSGLRGQSTPRALNTLNGLGRLASTRGDRRLAEEYFRITEPELLREEPLSPLTAENQAELASVMFGNGRDLEAARSRLQKAEDIDSVFERKLGLARDKLIRATDDPAVDDVARAKILAEVRKLLEPCAPRSLWMARLEFQEGLLAGNQNRFDEANQHFSKALAILETAAPHSLAYASGLHNIADVAKDPAAAEKLSRKALDVVRNEAADFPGEQGLELYSWSLAKFGVALADQQIAHGKPVEALSTLEESRSNGLLRLIAERGKLEGSAWRRQQIALSMQNTYEKEYNDAIAAVSAARQNLNVLYSRNAPSDEINRGEDLVSARAGAFETARDKYVGSLIGSEALWIPPEGSVRKVETPVPASVLQKKLEAGTVFVMFAAGNRKLIVAVVQGGSPEVQTAVIRLRDKVVHAPCGDGSKDDSGLTLDTAVGCYRALLERSLLSRGFGQAMTPLARALFDQLFPGKLRSTVLSAKRLVISPDAFLWRIPFAALVSNAAGTPEYLGLQVPISYTASLQAWTADHERQPQSRSGGQVSALVVGDPEQQIAPELSEARRESQMVGCLYGTKPLERETATEDQVRKAIESADIVHFATHGLLDPDLPMFSALQLAQPSASKSATGEDPEHDGKLEAWEVFSQLRIKAELVVLSACETASGRTVRGEGVVGLPRSFQYAGAHSVLASLWRVQDPSTESLMEGFYQGLSQGLAKDLALQKAMQKVQARDGWENPVYWAAFELMGNPENGGLKSSLQPQCSH